MPPVRLVWLGLLPVLSGGCLASGREEGSSAPSGPPSALPGPGEVRLLAGSRRVPVELGSAGAGRRVLEPLSGVRVVSEASPGGGSGSLRVRDERESGAPPLGTELAVRLPDLAGALPRVPPGQVRESRRLRWGVGNGGLGLARGLFDPATGRGLVVTASRELTLELGRAAQGDPVLRVEGPIGRRGEVELLGWRRAPRESEGARDGSGRAAAAARARRLVAGGLLFVPGPSGLDGLREALDALPRAGLEGVEIGRGRAPGGDGGPFRARPPDGTRVDLERWPGGLAAAVREAASRGLVPGLTIVPFGEGDIAAFEERPEAFVRDGRGRPVPGGALGPLVVDASTAAGRARLRGLGRRLRELGFGFLRLEGLAEALDAYEVHGPLLGGRDRTPAEAFRAGLRALRRGAGPGLALFGEAGPPAEAHALLDAVPPDPALEGGARPVLRDLLALARRAGGRGPEVEAPWPERTVRSSSPSPAPRRLALLGALTGRGPRIPPGLDPGEARFRLAAAWPPVRARPLAAPRTGAPPPRLIVVALPDDGAGARRVAGAFPPAGGPERRVVLTASALGISSEAARRATVCDLLEGEVVHRGPLPWDALVLPGETLLVSVLAGDAEPPAPAGVAGRPLGLEARLRGVRVLRDGDGLSGTARLSRGESLRIPLRLPPGRRAAAATARGATAHLEPSPGGPVLVLDDAAGGGARAGASSRTEGGRPLREVSIPFRVDLGEAATSPPPRLELDGEPAPRFGGILLSWRPVEGTGLPGPCVVWRDGDRLGRTAGSRWLDRGVAAGERATWTVVPERALPSGGGGDAAGSEGTAAGGPPPDVGGRVTVRRPDPAPRPLAELAPRQWSGTAPPVPGGSARGGPLRVRGEPAPEGLGQIAPARATWRVEAAHEELVVRVAVDDVAGLGGEVVAAVRLDGEEAWRSEVLRGGEEPVAVRIDIGDARRLALVVECPAGTGVPVAWGEARVVPAD